MRLIYAMLGSALYSQPVFAGEGPVSPAEAAKEFETHREKFTAATERAEQDLEDGNIVGAMEEDATRQAEILAGRAIADQQIAAGHGHEMAQSLRELGDPESAEVVDEVTDLRANEG